MSLFCADLIQAVGTVMDIKWIMGGKVRTGSFCTLANAACGTRARPLQLAVRMALPTNLNSVSHSRRWRLHPPRTCFLRRRVSPRVGTTPIGAAARRLTRSRTTRAPHPTLEASLGELETTPSLGAKQCRV